MFFIDKTFRFTATFMITFKDINSEAVLLNRTGRKDQNFVFWKTVVKCFILAKMLALLM